MCGFFAVTRADKSLAIVQCRQSERGGVQASPVLTNDLGRAVAVASGCIFLPPPVAAALGGSSGGGSGGGRAAAVHSRPCCSAPSCWAQWMEC